MLSQKYMKSNSIANNGHYDYIISNCTVCLQYIARTFGRLQKGIYCHIVFTRRSLCLSIDLLRLTV